VRRIFLTAWTIWLFDFATKQWAISALAGEPKQILGSFLQLTLVKNPGAAFGFATGLTLLYSILAVLVVATIVYFARAISSGGWQLTAGLLLGSQLSFAGTSLIGLNCRIGQCLISRTLQS